MSVLTCWRSPLHSQSRTKRYACFAAMAVAFFFVVSMSDSTPVSTELRSGQSKKHSISKTAPSTPGGPSSNGQQFDDDSHDDIAPDEPDEGLDEDVEFQQNEDKFDRAVSEEVKDNEGDITKAEMKILKKPFKKLGGLLDDAGIDLSDEQIETLQQAIQGKLDDRVHAYIKKGTDELLETEKNEFKNDLDIDAEENLEQAKDDEENQSKEIVSKLKSSTAQICDEATDKMKKWVPQAEKEAIEKYLEEIKSKEYVVTIDNGKVTEIKKKKKTKKTTKKAKKADDDDDDDTGGDDDDDASDDDAGEDDDDNTGDDDA